jgi:hypothetical protein
MTKEFVPYELALKLKELGFNEPCFGYYFTLNGTDWKFADNHEYFEIDDQLVIGTNFTLLAPLFQQAFRWFRENGFLIDFSSHDKDTHDFYIKWGVFEQRGSILSDAYNTYEEAELACLDKLIEIVDLKQQEQ